MNIILLLINILIITTDGFRIHRFYLKNKPNTNLLLSRHNNMYNPINNFNITSNLKTESTAINTTLLNPNTKKILGGYDERYPIHNNFDYQIISIKNNLIKYELLKKLISEKNSEIEKIKLINTNNYLFNDNIFNDNTFDNVNNIRAPNILAGGLDKELEEFNFTNTIDRIR